MNLDLARRDTIAAVATAHGAGAIAIIRVSGPQTAAIRDRIFAPRRPGPFVSAQLRLGDLVPAGVAAAGAVREQALDEVLCAWFAPGQSYTGEAMVELHLHGGPVNVGHCLRAVLDQGARLATPGEFTLRAFLGDRLDLAQAEAVQQIVGARSLAELQLAQRALRGAIGDALQPIERVLLALLAEVEAHLDFPEDELPPEQQAERAATVARLTDQLEQQRASAATGARLCQRPRLVLSGPPNAGKSTLFNALCGIDRAITDAVAGTTRDVLEVPALIEAVEVTLVDTAGLQPTASGVSGEAMRRARHAAQDADLLLLVFDGAAPLDETAQQVLQQAAPGALRVANKIDLDGCPGTLTALGADARAVSALTGAGLGELRRAIAQRLAPARAALDRDWIVINERHASLLEQAAAALRDAGSALAQRQPDEVLALELRRALLALAAIVGGDPTDQVLHAIFDRFCIGK